MQLSSAPGWEHASSRRWHGELRRVSLLQLAKLNAVDHTNINISTIAVELEIYSAASHTCPDRHTKRACCNSSQATLMYRELESILTLGPGHTTSCRILEGTSRTLAIEAHRGTGNHKNLLVGALQLQYV